MKNSYTIFGQGFVGTNILKFLKRKKYKIFVPKRGKFKFNKNLHNVIYCIGSDNWIKDPKGSYDANLGMVPKIIFNNKFSSFTFISSTRVYLGHIHKKTNETSSIQIYPDIKNFYFNSLKLTAESLCLSLPNKKIKVVRISNLFGDNFTNQIYLLPTLIRDSINNKKINILINKKSSKDYLHVDEAFDVLLKIIKKGKYRLYNIASGKNVELLKISEKIKKITNCKIIFKNQNKLIKEPIINIDRIKKEFNFKSKKDLIKSLDQLIANYNYHA
jgi:nucleoside-diphosphate-sugar epimerase|tara:strand:+ start:145 stop:963 length:819 start_codon:yes stop_codon:yes gene_type:complete